MRPLLLAISSLALVGCTKPPPAITGVTVSGTVTNGGVPVVNGAVTFKPETGPAASTMIVEGKYEIQVPTGKYTVAVVPTAVAGKASPAVSEKYKKGVPVEIGGANPALDFNLSK